MAGFHTLGLDTQKGKGMDPVTIGLAAASALGGLLGGGGEGQERESFRGTGADPILTLRDALDSIKRMGMSIGGAPPLKVGGGVRLKSPGPVNVPGVPFQIGGALGADPGMGDPAYLNPYALAEQIFKPMGGQAGGGPLKTDQGAFGTGMGMWQAATQDGGIEDFRKRIGANQDQGGRL